MQETQVSSLGQKDPLEKGMATHSSILAWRIPWTEEPDVITGHAVSQLYTCLNFYFFLEYLSRLLWDSVKASFYSEGLLWISRLSLALLFFSTYHIFMELFPYIPTVIQWSTYMVVVFKGQLFVSFILCPLSIQRTTHQYLVALGCSVVGNIQTLKSDCQKQLG